jgi:predicted hydrocarbon binding protein
MGRIFMSAVDEVLGRSERQTLFAASAPAERRKMRDDLFGFTHEQIARFQAVLVRSSGERAGRGLSHQIGRSFSKYLLQDLGVELGLESFDFRLLPSRKRIRTGLDLFARAFNENTDQKVRLVEGNGRLLWSVDPCPFCLQTVDGQAYCDWTVGFLQEALSWLSGGKYYKVTEEKCIARGAGKCTIGIDPTPLIG